MAFRVPPFVWETVSSPGSGTITTAGTLPSGQTGALPFASGGVGASDGSGNLTVGDTFPYSLRGQTTGATERGIGTVTAISGSTLTFTRAPIYPASGAVAFSETCDLLIDGIADGFSLNDAYTLSGGVTTGTALGYTNALDTFNDGNPTENTGALNGWENYWLFRWRGPRKISTCSLVVTTAGSATYSLGIMNIGASSLDLIQTITTGGFSDTTTGAQTISGLSFDLPQGDYVLQMVIASGSQGQLLNSSPRVPAAGPNFGWQLFSGGYLPARGFLNNAGASTLASSFSGTPGGGLQELKAFPKIWFNGTN